MRQYEPIIKQPWTSIELTPIFDSRKSFYGKAKVIQGANHSYDLYSYDTRVASIRKTKGGIMTAQVYGSYSQTTLRHIKEFLTQYHFKAENKAQIRADYSLSHWEE